MDGSFPVIAENAKYKKKDTYMKYEKIIFIFILYVAKLATSRTAISVGKVTSEM